MNPLKCVLCTLVVLAIPFTLHAAESARRPEAPKCEVRAVWLATYSGLDWPRTTDKAGQQASLLRMIETIRDAGFNTIFFQVRARGDAYYRSSIEPWAENLAGSLGADPGWDPLSYLIDHAHHAGIEVHAWFNVYKVRSGNHLTGSTPLHPARAHPEWSVTYQNETWLDPGIPSVRAYLGKVVLDIVKRYDLDGVNFDYARYPGRDFPDDNTYRRFGGTATRSDWRRANITSFITESYAAITAVKPWVKVGASPLGYLGLPGDSTTGATANFYQDARAWLKAGKLDYVAPQIYWEIGEQRKELDFAGLLAGWMKGSYGRHVYAGIAAYKPEIARRIGEYVDSSRAAGGAGQSYFRWENISSLGRIDGRYRTPALIPPMPWKSTAPPLPPPLLAVAEGDRNVFHLEWLPDTMSAVRPARYAVYRWTTSPRPFSEPGTLIGVTPDSSRHWIDTLLAPKSPITSYAVASVDRYNTESAPGMIAGVVTREFTSLKGRLQDVMGLSAWIPSTGGAPRLVGYSLPRRSDVLLTLLAVAPGGPDSLVTTLARGPQDEGTHIVGLNGTRLAPGRYLVRLLTTEGELVQDVELK
jgi:uncharacterized lipoprotein YddW (UPF0748 family)